MPESAGFRVVGRRAAAPPRSRGVEACLHRKTSRPVEVGEPMHTIYAEHEHKLEEALAPADQLKPFQIEGMVIEEIVE